MGVATGDFNNDGCTDLYLTNLGAEPAVSQQLRRHVHRRVEAEPYRRSVVERLGVVLRLRPRRLARSVRRQLSRLARRTPACRASARPGGPTTVRRTCIQPQPSRLYHNNRDGTFTDVTAASGIARDFGPALGVSTADFNGDGWIDLYVANDGQPNQLWINQHDGTFRNIGPPVGHGVERARQSQGRHGRRCRGFRQRRRRRPVRHEPDGRRKRPVRQRRGGPLRRAERAIGAQPGQPSVHRLRRGLVRHRQRRLARHARSSTARCRRSRR